MTGPLVPAAHRDAVTSPKVVRYNIKIGAIRVARDRFWTLIVLPSTRYYIGSAPGSKMILPK